MDGNEILKHYSRQEIQEEILKSTENREVAVRYKDFFGARPDVIRYPSDISEAAKNGATSFHCSEEIWTNPMLLKPGMPKKQLDTIRKGWDLVVDIDCDFLEYSKIAADIIIKAFRQFNIKNVSCKFSGRSGFHIGLCFESFPDKVLDKPIKDWFPEGPRAVASYLIHIIKPKLSESILDFESIEKIMERTKKPFNELVKDNKFDPYSVLGIDTVLISSRHLYRSSYSLNEKSGLVSIPVDPNKVLGFSINDAKIANVKVSEFRFLDKSKAVKGEATNLMVAAFDYTTKIGYQEEKQEKEYEELTEAITQEFFPYCIKKGLKGMEDGKKRFLFILMNFLNSVGWSYNEIEALVKEWNQKNPEPLRESYVMGQLRYQKMTKKKVLPPNCANSDYYKGLGLYCEDVNHDKCKNPVSACLWNWKRAKKKG